MQHCLEPDVRFRGPVQCTVCAVACKDGLPAHDALGFFLSEPLQASSLAQDLHNVLHRNVRFAIIAVCALVFQQLTYQLLCAWLFMISTATPSAASHYSIITLRDLSHVEQYLGSGCMMPR